MRVLAAQLAARSVDAARRLSKKIAGASVLRGPDLIDDAKSLWVENRFRFVRKAGPD